MRLVIAEKPSVAMALARVLGAGTRRDGYMEGGGLAGELVRRPSGGARRPGRLRPPLLQVGL